MIYADHAATTALLPAAFDAMLPYLAEQYGNPSSQHAMGMAAARGMLFAREKMAAALGCQPREIYFTSGGSEANNQALYTMAALGRQEGRRHIVCSAFEHPSVLRALDFLQTCGFAVTQVAPGADGIVSIQALAAALRPDTVGVSLMTANNEIGTLQPVREAAALCHSKKLLFHTDAVQAVGHIPVSFCGGAADFLSLSAHKFGGPKGAGALLVKAGLAPAALIRGGPQERGCRAGTENVAAIVGMAAALEESCRGMAQKAAAVTALREQLITGMLAIPGVSLTGARDCRVPGTAHFCLRGAEAETVLALLDEKGICASAGSACSAGALEESHVLASMGIPPELARGALRLSLGWDNTPQQVENILAAVREIMLHLREESV